MSKYLCGGRRDLGEDAQEQYSWIIQQIYVLPLKMPRTNFQGCGLCLKFHKECSSFPTSISALSFPLFKSQPIYQLKYQSSFNLYVPNCWDVSKKDFSTICTFSFENFLFSSWPHFKLGCFLGIWVFEFFVYSRQKTSVTCIASKDTSLFLRLPLPSNDSILCCRDTFKDHEILIVNYLSQRLLYQSPARIVLSCA